MTSTPQSRTTPKPATVAGLLGILSAVMLAGGTGFAYAASTDVVESGYLTVVDETTTSSTTTSSTTTAADCPDSSGEAGAR